MAPAVASAPAAAVSLPAPTVVGPGTAASPGPVLTTATPTFTWHAETGVAFSSYELNLYDGTAAKSYVYQLATSATSYTVTTALPTGDAYVWNLRLVDGTVTGPPSTYLYFQAPGKSLALPAPTVLGPGTTASPGPVLTTATPTFTWDAESGVTFTSYELNLYDNTAAKSYVYQVATSATSFTVPAALPTGDSYVWNLRLVDGSMTGPPSTYLYFQTPKPVTLPAPVVVGPGTTASPGPVLTGTTPTFTWKAVTGVAFDTYQLNLYDETSAKFLTFQVPNTATSFTPPAGDLAAGDAFVWNLRLVDGTVSGPPSTYLYFQTPKPVTLPAPVVIGPGTTASPGPVLTTTTPTFTWKAETGVTFTAYQLNLYDETAAKSYSYQIATTATSFTVPAGTLTAGDAFVWNLRLVDGTVSGPPSTYLYFQTPKPVALPAPVVIGPGTTASPGPVLTTTTPTFTWKAETGVTFTAYQLNLYDQTAAKSYSYQIATTATSFTVPAGTLAAGDAFVWNLRLVDGTVSGPPSTYLYFQTPKPVALPAPVVVGPGTTASPGPVLTTTTPTFTWKAETGVTFTAYQLNLYDETAAKSYSYQIATTATSFTVPAGTLTAGDAFVWNLRLVDGTVSGPPSTYLYFQTPKPVALPAPVVIGPGTTTSPGPVLTTTTPTFTWKAVTGVAFDTYQLNLYDETSAKFLTFQIANTATSFTPPAGDLAAGDTFVWNLRLKVGDTTGPESAYLYFQT